MHVAAVTRYNGSGTTSRTLICGLGWRDFFKYLRSPFRDFAVRKFHIPLHFRGLWEQVREKSTSMQEPVLLHVTDTLPT